MVAPENLVNEPKVQAKVHIPRARSPKRSRPYCLDWVMEHQVGVSLSQLPNEIVYSIDLCRDSFNFDLGCSLTAHSLSPVPSLHTEILAIILRITDGPNIQAGF